MSVTIFKRSINLEIRNLLWKILQKFRKAKSTRGKFSGTNYKRISKTMDKSMTLWTKIKLIID